MAETPNPLRYYRDRSGQIVHRSYCGRVGRTSAPWHFADDMTADDLTLIMARTPWLRPCAICRPDKFDYTEAIRSMDQSEPGIEGCVGCFRCRASDHGTCHGCGCRCNGEYGGESCPESCTFGGVRQQRQRAEAAS